MFQAQSQFCQESKVGSAKRKISVSHQIFRLDILQHLANVLAEILAFDFCIETNAAFFRTIADDLIETRERTATDEQDIGGINLQKLLLRVLSSTLRRNRRNRAFNKLEQCLLHALTRYIPRY